MNNVLVNLSTLNDLKSKILNDEGSHLPALRTMPGVLVSYSSNLMENPDIYFDSVMYKCQRDLKRSFSFSVCYM